MELGSVLCLDLSGNFTALLTCENSLDCSHFRFLPFTACMIYHHLKWNQLPGPHPQTHLMTLMQYKDLSGENSALHPISSCLCSASV